MIQQNNIYNKFDQTTYYNICMSLSLYKSITLLLKYVYKRQILEESV
jgi:hypothetical protein